MLNPKELIKQIEKNVNILDLDSGIHKGHWTYDDILVDRLTAYKEMRDSMIKEFDDFIKEKIKIIKLITDDEIKEVRFLFSDWEELKESLK